MNQEEFYIVCDQAGAPFLFFTPSGQIAKEVSRSPYGHITYDSAPEISVPLGILAGIQDAETDLVHIQTEERRGVYDGFSGSFLTPQWESVRQNLHRPENLLLYRINGNDPVNLPTRRRLGRFFFWLAAPVL